MRFSVALIAILMAITPKQAKAADVQGFLKNCGWGTLAGAGAGILSLAFEDRPSDHTINIARGASLGLYGGIIYGVIELQNERRMKESSSYGLIPSFDKNWNLEGAKLEGIVARF